MKKKLLAGLTTILFVFGMVGFASATAIYAIDIGLSGQDGVTRIADFTTEGFDPLSEYVTYAYVWQMVKSTSTRSTATAWLTVEDNGNEQENGVSAWRKISLTLYDFTPIDLDGTIIFTVSSPSGSIYTGAGGFSIETEVAPVPEPATILLFGTGLVGLIGSRLRKKKK